MLDCGAAALTVSITSSLWMEGDSCVPTPFAFHSAPLPPTPLSDSQ